MSTTPFLLSTGSLTQSWTDAGLIATNDDWANVPSIVGYLGDIDTATPTGVDPRTLTAAALGAVDVIANQTNPDTLTAGGVAEFAIPNPTVALQGSGTADAPSLVIYLDSTGRQNVTVALNGRDIDGSTDDAIQAVNVQYRLGDTSAWTNVTGGYVADATTAGAATQTTPVSVTLPAEANNQAGLQVRILTTNALGSDEWVGLDDILVSSTAVGPVVPPPPTGTTLTIANASTTEGNNGAKQLVFDVVRSNTTGAVTFDIATAAGTATAGTDYTERSVTGATFAAGQSTFRFGVNISLDTAVEGNETLTATLRNVVGATAATPSATGNIVNDDVAGAPAITILPEAASLAGSVGATATTGPVGTGRLDLVRLGAFAAGTGNAEVVSFDPVTDQLYILNTDQNRIDIVRVSTAGALAKTGEIALAGLPGFGSANSVAVRGNVVAVAYQAPVATDRGAVALFDAAGALQKVVQSGVLPDQLVFTPDGSRILVANEAEAASATSNADGTIDIISLAGGVANASVVNTIYFDSLNGSETALRTQGLALFAGQTASADIEPEYITVNAAGTRAYVTLQEVNAVAVIDLSNPTANRPVALLPLGGVNHALPGNEFDPTDRPTAAISIGAFPATGLLQPDAIASFTAADGLTYFITANEGDSRVGGLADEARVNAATYTLDPTAFPNAAALEGDAQLGRLNVLRNRGDTDGDGDFDQIFTLGGRSITIFRQNADGTITKVRETGGEFEKIIARDAPDLFNTDQTATPIIDDRSDNKGPEPEGVTIGVVGGRTYAFVGLERTGGVMVYDVTEPANARFVSYERPAQAGTGPQPTTVLDRGPEVLTFISAADSPTGQALVVAANETSGNTVLYAAQATTPIFEVQGIGHRSPLVGQQVTVRGIVTAVDAVGTENNGNNPVGYYLQERVGDGDYRSSDAVFVFLGTGASATIPAGVVVGAEVQVTATVSEFASANQLSSTQLTPIANTTTIVSTGNALPTAVRVGDVDNFMTGLERRPALVSLGDDDGDTTPPPGIYDPINQGADFWESLEAMRVTLEDVRIVSAFRSNFDEQFGTPNVGANPSANARGGLTISDTTPATVQPAAKVFDFNPERIQIDDEAGITLPRGLQTGDRIGDVTGVVNYANSQYEVNPTQAIGVVTPGNLPREITTITPNLDRVRVASFNVENLAPVGQPVDGEPTTQGKFAGLATAIVTNLRSPDILALQEVLDNDGAANTADTSGATTLAQLILAVVAAGGPRYTAIDSRPVDDTVGGIPGGNQRVAYLFNPDAVAPTARNNLTTVAGTPTGATVLEAPLSSQIGQGNSDYNATRKSLPVEWLPAGYTDAQGGSFFTVNNHLSSKGGSAPLYGTNLELPLYADPLNGSAQSANATENEREGQAELINAYVEAVLANASTTDNRIVVLGDLNDFQFFPVVDLITGQVVRTTANPDGVASIFAPGTAVLAELSDKLPVQERYSFNFDGNAQTLDHILVSNELFAATDFDIIHINSEFIEQVSDHDPSVASLPFTRSAALATAGNDTLDQAAFTAQFGATRGSLAGADIIDALGGDDRIATGGGNDTIDGGANGAAGDTVVFTGARASYTVAAQGGGLLITDTRTTGGDGQDTIANVENFQFSDGTVTAANLADLGAPTLVSSNPADNATGIALAANVVLTFNEAVRAGAGNITVTNGAGDVRTIPVTDAAQVAFSGAGVTIDPTANLAANTAYDVLVPAGAIVDAAGNAFAGLAQDRLDFTTTTTGSANMPYTLQILHASDFEAGVAAIGRAGNFAAIVDRLEDSTPNSITLSTGDGYLPSPFFLAGGDPALAATYNGVYNQLFGLTAPNGYRALTASAGRADITIQNIIGIQAATFGNHEFDNGTVEIRNIIGANLGAAAGPADDAWIGSLFPYLSTNLDFTRDVGTSGLADLFTPNLTTAGFALTSPTSTQTGTGADKIARSTVITENGELIAFVSATTQALPNISSPGLVTVIGGPGDNIPLLAQQINAEVDRVLAANPGLNKVIVGTHLQQLSNEQALAPLLRNVDVLIGGGSNTRLADGNDRLRDGDVAQGAYPQTFTNATGQQLLLVNTDGEYSYVGRLTFTFDDAGNVIPSSVDSTRSGEVAVDDRTVTELYGSRAAGFTPGSKGFLVQQVIEGLDANNDGVQETSGVADVIRQQDGNILGRTSVYLEGRRADIRTEETNLGNFTADANLFYARQFDPTVTISIKNGGGIRDSIGSFTERGVEQGPAANPLANKALGDISQLDVANSLRFNNNLSLVTVSASELERILEHAVSATAPGATPGQFGQVGGISYSFDPAQTAQVLDNNGDVTTVGNRIRSAAIINETGQLVDTLVQGGQLVGDANRNFRAVTLDFLANPGTGTLLGGDRYPFPAYGEQRVNLRDVANTTIPNVQTFAAQGSEQDALAEYLEAFFSVTPFNVADTNAPQDLRIENLAADPVDTVLARSSVLRGGDATNDVLNGGAGADIINGLGGDDRISGLGGNDFIIAGPGNDIVNAGDGNDTVLLGTGDDFLVAGPGNDNAQGDAGNDTILLGDGNDGATGDAGDDNIDGGAGDDLILAGTGNDGVLGGDGADLIQAGAGDDLVRAGPGNDRVFGEAGADSLFGDEGDDFLIGEAGDDSIFGGDGADTIDGGTGNDAIEGGAGRDTIGGGAGNDIIRAGADGDYVDGAAGDDFLFGDEGEDLVFGGLGRDTLSGGAGSDVFLFRSGDGPDIITDFTTGLAADAVALQGTGLTTFAQVQERLSLFGTNTTVLTLGSDQLLFANTTPGQFQGNDFFFIA